jgi:hypothetical protein
VDGNVGNGGVENVLNVESHLCFQMCFSYSATVIRVCLRVLVSIILITICILKIVISPIFCCKSAHCVV